MMFVIYLFMSILIGALVTCGGMLLLIVSGRDTKRNMIHLFMPSTFIALVGFLSFHSINDETVYKDYHVTSIIEGGNSVRVTLKNENGEFIYTLEECKSKVSVNQMLKNVLTREHIFIERPSTFIVADDELSLYVCE